MGYTSEMLLKYCSLGGVVCADIWETPTVEPLRQEHQQERLACPDLGRFLKEIQYGQGFSYKEQWGSRGYKKLIPQMEGGAMHTLNTLLRGSRA